MGKCYIYIIAAIILFSCKRENMHDFDVISVDIPEPQIVVDGSLFGQVYDQDEIPLSDVRISSIESIKLSDEFGFFKIDNEKFNSRGYYLKAEKEGYFDNSKLVQSTGNSVDNITFILAQKNNYFNYENDSNQSTDLTNGLNIKIPSSAFEYSDGSDYEGTVNIYHEWITISNPLFHELMPGNLTGLNENEEEVGLNSLGVLLLQAENSQGEKLELKSDKSIFISVPISNSINVGLETFSAWQKDNSLYRWVKNGRSTIEDNKFSFEIFKIAPHTLGNEFNQVRINGKIKNTLLSANAKSVQSIKLTISDENGLPIAHDETDDHGNFAALIPANKNVFIKFIDYCENEIKTLPLGPYEADQDIGEISLSISNSFKIIGSISDCDGFSVENPIILITNNQKREAYRISNPDDFEIEIFSCHDEALDIEFLDLDKKILTNSIQKDKSAYVECGEIIICDEPIKNYFSILLDGKEGLFFDYHEANIMSDETNSIISIEIPSANNPSYTLLGMQFKLEEGLFAASDILQWLRFDNSENALTDDDPLHFRADCIEDDYTCPINLSISKITPRSVEGSFIGEIEFEVTYKNNIIKYESHIITCTFAVRY